MKKIVINILLILFGSGMVLYGVHIDSTVWKRNSLIFAIGWTIILIIRVIICFNEKRNTGTEA